MGELSVPVQEVSQRAGVFNSAAASHDSHAMPRIAFHTSEGLVFGTYFLQLRAQTRETGVDWN